MGNLTFTHYISKYRGVILKLEGLDDFQKVRGFIRGLHRDYKAKVKTQYPKTLEDAIKDAQIYDDTNEKTIHTFAQEKTNVHKKRKAPFAPRHKGDSAKKSPKTKGPLSSDELARARKERLCFLCMGNHQRKDCPRALNDKQDKGKEKVVHTV